jgi:hypothetical protein
MRLLKSGLLASATAISIAVAFAYLKRPYPVIFGIASAAFLLQAFALTKGRVTRNILLSISSCLLVLCLAEIALSYLEEWKKGSQSYLFEPPRARHKGGWDPHWRVHDVIGYMPVPDSTVRVTKRFRDTVVYDVRYGLNENGWRKIPASDDAAHDSILFFGGSFAFGEGLNDDETIPNYVVRFLGGRYSAYSFAFGGYGAHEMLAILEHGLEAGWMREGDVPRIAIYLAVSHHVARVAGNTSWNRFGPLYVVDGESAKCVGSFSDRDLVPRWANRLLMPSGLMRRFYYNRFLMQPVTREHRLLFARVVEKAKRLFEAKYPGGEFHLALLGSPDESWPQVNLPPERVHRTWEALPPEFWTGEEPPGRYFIEHDGHSTALTNRLIASFLIAKLKLDSSSALSSSAQATPAGGSHPSDSAGWPGRGRSRFR